MSKARNIADLMQSDGSVEVDRIGSDGAIIDLRKDGTTVGSIGTDANSEMFISGAGNRGGIGFYDSASGAAIQPANSNGTASNGDTDLGIDSNRWRNLYLSGGVYLGGTLPANHLDDYEEGTWTPTVAASGNGAGVPSAYMAVGKYTKTGNVVVASLTLIATTGSFTWTGLNSYFRIYGFPFDSLDDLNSFAIATGNIASTGAKGVGKMIAGTPNAYFWSMESSGGSVTQLSATVTYATSA